MILVDRVTVMNKDEIDPAPIDLYLIPDNQVVADSLVH
jgi:hypothetical protein